MVYGFGSLLMAVVGTEIVYGIMPVLRKFARCPQVGDLNGAGAVRVGEVSDEEKVVDDDGVVW
jgi:hypothetical protein